VELSTKFTHFLDLMELGIELEPTTN